MCKELTVSRNGQPIHCIAFVKFAPASTGDDIKDGHLALELIVGTGDVYQGEGLDMTRSSDDPRRMHRALEALTDKFPSTSEVDMSLDAGAGGQAVSVHKVVSIPYLEYPVCFYVAF